MEDVRLKIKDLRLFTGYCLLVTAMALFGVAEGNSGVVWAAASLFPFGVPLRGQVLFAPEGDGSRGGAESQSDSGGSGSGAGGISNDEGGSSEPVAPSGDGGSRGGAEPQSDSGLSAMDQLIAETDAKFSEQGSVSSEQKNSGVGSQESEGETSKAAPSADGSKQEAEPEYQPGFEPDLVEVDGEDAKYYFHPTVHGKDTGQGTTYKDRDSAEFGVVNKVNRLNELVSKLNEAGKGVGAVDLPEWFGDPNDPNQVLKAGEMEEIASLPNEQLRTRIAEADKLITKFSEREKKVSSEVQNSKALDEFKTKQNELADKLDATLDALGIGDEIFEINLKDDKAAEKLQSALEGARDKKVASELKPLVDEYNKFKKDEDARLNDDDYADKLEEKLNAISAKRTELTNKYNEQLGVVNEISELQEQAAKIQTPVDEKAQLKQQTEQVVSVLQELGREVQHPMFESTDPAGVKQFFNFVMNNVEKYNGVKNTYDANRALKDFDARTQKLREQHRLKQIQDDNKKAADQRAKDMPGYGNQDNLIKPKSDHVYDKNAAELEQLAAETDKRFS